MIVLRRAHHMWGPAMGWHHLNVRSRRWWAARLHSICSRRLWVWHRWAARVLLYVCTRRGRRKMHRLPAWMLYSVPSRCWWVNW